MQRRTRYCRICVREKENHRRTLKRAAAALLVIGCCFCTPLKTRAQWAVFDGAAAQQRILQLAEAVATTANTANAYIRQGQQIVNEYNIIRQQILQFETMVKNLQRIPEGLNFFDTIMAYGSKIDGLLSQANAISFELTQAERDFDRLYRQSVQLTSSQGIMQLRQQLLSARLDTSGLAVRTQSIRTNLTDLYTRLCNLLNGSWLASGNLDSQQLAHQQQALLIHSQQTAQAMFATQARLQAQKEAEEVVLEQLRLKMLQDATAPVAPYTEARGKLPVYRWVD
jgi:P-type conjugative transfer protein TrbJ